MPRVPPHNHQNRSLGGGDFVPHGVADFSNAEEVIGVATTDETIPNHLAAGDILPFLTYNTTASDSVSTTSTTWASLTDLLEIEAVTPSDWLPTGYSTLYVAFGCHVDTGGELANFRIQNTTHVENVATALDVNQVGPLWTGFAAYNPTTPADPARYEFQARSETGVSATVTSPHAIIGIQL